MPPAWPAVAGRSVEPSAGHPVDRGPGRPARSTRAARRAPRSAKRSAARIGGHSGALQPVARQAAPLAPEGVRDSRNLAKAEFDAVTWARWPPAPASGSPARRPRSCDRPRLAVFDEIYARSADVTGLDRRALLQVAERVYRGLRESYEARKDHPRARDFYFGEMELRRFAGPPISLTALYGLFSGYGERWTWPLRWFVVLVVVCALLYLAVGLDLKVTERDAAGVGRVAQLQASGGDHARPDPRAELPDHGGAALLHSLYVGTFIGRDTYAAPRNTPGHLVQMVELTLGPLLLALAALAVRRLFQR